MVLTLVLALGVLPLPNAHAAGGMRSGAAASPFPSRSVESLLKADGTLNLNTGWRGALDLRGWQVALDAERGPLFRPAVQDPAAPGASAWWRLGPAPSAGVGDIVVSGSDLYICGNFTSVGAVPANHIAKWDGSAWYALGTGTEGEIRTLTAGSGGDIYVGGDFTSAGGVPDTVHLAKWDGSAWSALGTGTNGPVNAIVVSGSDVFVGGPFSSAGGVAANHIARWDGSTWSALGTGTDTNVYTLAADGSNIYVGGSFLHAGGVSAASIARWDGAAWHALGAGTDGFVGAIAVSEGSLYAGGSFSHAGGVAASNIARWDGGAWSALGAGTNGYVNAVAVSGSDVYAGGFFARAGGVPGTNHIAKWDGSAWSALGTGTNDNVSAIALRGSDVYAGGPFLSAGGVVLTAYIARYGPPSINSDLRSLALSNGTLTPPFAPGTTAYSAAMAYAVASITVTPRVADFNATVKVNGTPVTSGSPSGAIALSVGANLVTIVVTAQDGVSTKTYTVAVTRAATADLTDLALSSGMLTPPFASGTGIYAATVASCATTVTVTPTALDPLAIMTVNGTPVASGHASAAIALHLGANIITTVVTAQDGVTSKIYTVTVTRVAEMKCSQAGGTWTEVDSPVTNSAWYLNSVAMVSSREGWAVGGRGMSPNGILYGPFILHWNGSTWSEVVISDSGSTDYDLRAIAMISANDGWAVGGADAFGAILRWDGTTWSRWKTATTNLRSLAILSPTDIWLAGSYRNCSVVPCDSASATCHWNGTVLQEKYDHHWYRLNSVAMISSTDGWAVGSNGEIKRWRGSAWTDVGSYNASSALYGAAMVSTGDGWAVGNAGRILRWDGSGWSQLSSPVSGNLNAVAMVSANNGWAVGDGGTILHWNGNTWDQVSSPVTEALKAVTMLSANEGWAVGAGGVILHYTDFHSLFLPLIVR